MKNPWFLSAVVLLAGLSGCLSSEEELEAFPTFSLADHETTTHNNSMYNGSPYVAYFSASWCSHCAPTLDAVVDAVPADHLLIFNLESNEDWSDMNAWKDKMESELERDIDHPFIHAPPLATTLGVDGLPTVFFVNSDGLIEQRVKGLQTPNAIQGHWNSLS
jgi:thiol-disulfide isomerase/thioredoxin